MRRLLIISSLAVFLSVPVWAQRGAGGHGSFSGSHSGVGGHAGFGGRASAGASHFSGGIRSGAGFSGARSHALRPGASRGPFLHDGFRSGGFRGRGLRNRRFLRNCLGYGCWGGYGYRYPWAYGAYYDPYWWWDSSSSYDEDYERDRATANDMNQQSLEEQQMFRQEQADGDRDLYARSTPSPRAATADQPQGAAMIPPTVLVFRDQHQKEIHNYAIVGQTLWNFASPRTEKISLADLDLAATVKANDDRGLTFKVPVSNEAQ